MKCPMVHLRQIPLHKRRMVEKVVFHPCWVGHLFSKSVQNALDGMRSMRTFKETLLKANEGRAIEAAEKIIIKQLAIKRVILFGSKARGLG